jgi:hypothetical protein
MWGISHVAENQLTSQARLCSTELISLLRSVYASSHHKEQIIKESKTYLTTYVKVNLE